MPYVNNVFISYKREQNWTSWTRDLFKSLLQSYLQRDLGRTPHIFVDERLEENFGQDWVVELATNLAQSRVSVIVFSRDYFDSDWCVPELDLMLARARLLGGQVSKVIIPVIGHDGQLIPDAVARLTPLDVKKFMTVGIYQGTPDYLDFSKRIRDLSPAVARAIEAVPPFDDIWLKTCLDRFNAVYEAQRRKEHLGPLEFALKPPPNSAANPQLRV
jgi:hypothetical protein